MGFMAVGVLGGPEKLISYVEQWCPLSLKMTWAKGKWERIPPILTFETLFLFILPFNGDFIGNRFKNSLHSFGLSYARHSRLHSLHRSSMLFLFVNPVDGGNLG